MRAAGVRAEPSSLTPIHGQPGLKFGLYRCERYTSSGRDGLSADCTDFRRSGYALDSRDPNI